MGNNITTAVILAGGQSSRFYPYNNFGHKSLVTLLGKTLLEHTLDSLKLVGVTDIIIVEGKSQTISQALAGANTDGLRIQFVVQEKADGMGDALLQAKKYLNSSFFVLGAYHFDFDKVTVEMSSLYLQDHSPVLLTKEEKDTSEFGLISKQNGKTVIREKSKDEMGGTRIIGIYLLNQAFLKTLSEQKKEHYNFETALEKYSNQNALSLIEAKGKTISLKYPWDLLAVKDYLLENIFSYVSGSSIVSKKAVIKGNVYIDDNATIMDGAIITGPVYIGKNAYVGTNAIIRGGVCVEANAVVGGLMEIKNSILMISATTHSGFIGDSVIGEKTRIAAGFNTANVRLDKKEVKVTVEGKKINTHRKYLGALIGSHVSLGITVGTMPGVIVGNNTVIGPVTTVLKNIEDNVTYYTEFKKTVKKKKI